MDNMKLLPPTYVEGFHDLEAVKAMEYRPLGTTKLMVSKLSFGGGPLGCHYGTFDEEEAIQAIREGIRRGINYIDTAPWYGQGRSETIIGKALKGIPRQAYYLATKVGRYELSHDKMFDFRKERTRKSFKKSLEVLGVEYVDVIQVHDIEFAPGLDIVITQTLPELSRQVAEGKAKYIGVTGYPVSILKECIEKSNVHISTVLCYTRYTLIDETLLSYMSFFKGQDVELGRIAMWHAMQYNEVATNLVGIQNLKQLRMNLDTCLNGISDKEKEILKELQANYLSEVKGQHWEGKEVAQYWANVQ